MANAKKLPSGNYRCLVYAGRDRTGKRVYKSFTAPTRGEAEYMAASWKLNAKDDDKTPVTFGEALDRYIESKSNVLSPATYRLYRSLQQQVFRDIEGINVRSITQEDIQKFVNAHAEEYRTSSLKLQVCILLSAIHVIRPDFSPKILYPKEARKDTHIPNDEEIRAILAACDDINVRRAVILAAFGSLRIGEVCALMGADVKGTYITVNKTMVNNVENQWIIKPPKTAGSTRKVAFPAEIIAELRCGDGERVVNYNPMQLRYKFAKTLKKADIQPFKFHALRHYQASKLHALGVPEKYIMQRGGWESSQVLQNVYEHTLDDKEISINEMIGNYFLQLCNTKCNMGTDKR